jgi:hypothetical protein
MTLAFALHPDSPMTLADPAWHRDVPPAPARAAGAIFGRVPKSAYLAKTGRVFAGYKESPGKSRDLDEI